MNKSDIIENIKLNKKDFFIIYIIVIITILAINQGMIQAGTLGMISVIVVLSFLNIESLFICSIMLAPLVNILKIQDGITIMPIIFLLGITKILLKNNIKINIKTLIFFTIFVASNAFNSLYRFGFQPEVYSMALLLLYVYLFMSNYQYKLPSLFNAISFTFILSMLIYCIGSDIFPNVVNVVAQKSEFTTRNVGFTNDWSYGQFLALSIAFSSIQVRRGNLSIIKYICLMVVFFYYLIQTGSYTGLMAIGIFFLLFPFSTELNSKKKLYIALASMVAILVVFTFIAVYIFPKMLEVRSGNFGNNGRFDLWIFYLNLLKDNPDIFLFGVGIGCIKTFAAQLHMLTTHNVIIEKLVELGVIGFSIFISLLYKMSKNAVINIKKNEKILVLITMVATLMVQGVSGNPLPFLLMPATIFVNNISKK